MVVWVAPAGVDLAIVQAKASQEIEPVTWQAHPRVIVSQEVFAVGNPLGNDWTLTRGVVSALREIPPEASGLGYEVPIIQTDTSITFGNSGGGLYSYGTGELIGINTAINSRAQGIGYAIRPEILMQLKPKDLVLPAASNSETKADPASK